MSRTLGMSVGASSIHAVIVEHGAIKWAGSCSHDGPADLADAIARLSSECESLVRRIRVVLERDMVRCRTVLPAPRLRPRAAARYVALEAPRLFRSGATPLVTDAAILSLGSRRRALWAVAGAEPVARAVTAGCVQAGLALDALGAACEVLPEVVAGARQNGTLSFPRSGSTEVLDVARGHTWRSRLARGVPGAAPEWVGMLTALGAEAGSFAAAYAAAVARPRLLLLSSEARAAAGIRARRRLCRLAAGAAAAWVLALGIYGARVVAQERRIGAALARLRPGMDSALALRQDLAAARGASATLREAARRRSRYLALLAALTGALGDSTVIVGFRVTPDSSVHLAGYAPVAARVLADLERMRGLQRMKLEGPPSREVLGAASGFGRVWDRFAITGRLSISP